MAKIMSSSSVKPKNSASESSSEARIKELEDRTTSLEEQLKRAVADYHNLEKRIQEGRSELANWSTSELLKKLLPVLDNFERALMGASEAEKESGWYKGARMALTQMENVLKEEGLVQIVADGLFDPNLHEAIDTRDGEDNTILEIAQKGYTLNNKVVRPAGVIVGKKSEQAKEEN